MHRLFNIIKQDDYNSLASKIQIWEKKEIDFYSIEKSLENVKVLLLKHGIYEDYYYKKWHEDYITIYSSRKANLQLFTTLSLFYFIGILFVFKFVLNRKIKFDFGEYHLKIYNQLEETIKAEFENADLFEFEYFSPILNLSEKEGLREFNLLLLNLSEHLFNLNIPPEYLFDYLMHNIISPVIRHVIGEYYTPPFIVKKMVEEAYVFGEMVVDPCCGSGNFLIEIVKKILISDKSEKEKIRAINNIYGYDINPIAIFIAKINFLFLLKDNTSGVKFNLHCFDSLFPQKKSPSEKFDLIIGNPPWYTYRDIESIDYQEKIKKLAEGLGIKPLPKNILNLEISTLFFYQAKNILMKQGAKVFFIITKGVITGSHASRFRNFRGFSNVKIWTFEKKIEKIFNIDFICLFAQNSDNLTISLNQEIPLFYFEIDDDCRKIDYFKEVELKLKNTSALIPYSIEKKGNIIHVKKLISKERKKEMLPLKESYYKSLFHKGADLNPRNLVFIKCNLLNESLVKISPDDRIFNKAKIPWDQKEFENEIVEKKYIFKIIKSTELVKFVVYDHYHAFLPLLKKDLSFNYEKLSENAKNFYDKINHIYLKHKKETTKHESLMDNLNRWSKLINKRQLSKIKVVYNNSGSTLNSAVVQGDFLATGDLSFYETSDLNEAYYLTAILNSPLMSKQVQIRKSSRHIFKLPFELSLKKFEVRNPNHQKLAILGKKCQLVANSTFKDLYNNKNKNVSKIKIQNALIKELKPILTEIDAIVFKELSI